MAMNPDALFDCLFLTEHLNREGERIKPAGLHVFAYLSCLLWLYRYQSTADWGYNFVGTDLGAPFSADLESAINVLLSAGNLVRDQAGELSLSANAKKYLEEVGALELNQARKACLLGACSSAAAFSPGMVYGALANEPDLERARRIPVARQLLEDFAVKQLYSQFRILHDNLGQHSDDLRVPAVVWLTALQSSEEQGTAE